MDKINAVYWKMKALASGQIDKIVETKTMQIESSEGTVHIL